MAFLGFLIALTRTFLKENLVLEPEGATGGRLAGPEAACGRRERDLRKARPECCLTRDMCLTLALLQALRRKGSPSLGLSAKR